MKIYHKIQTVYKRDPDNKFKTLLEGQYSLPVFEFLADAKWVFTEKVDGTNIRVMLDDGELSFAGKTDAAQMPQPLLARLQSLFDVDQLRQVFDGCSQVCLYGEGYGAKIQKAGNLYGETQDFVLFDVKVGELWLERSSVEDIAQKLNLDVVPIVGEGTLHDMVGRCRVGMKSLWGDFQSEGLIARPKVEIRDRLGSRVITKLKTIDFS